MDESTRTQLRLDIEAVEEEEFKQNAVESIALASSRHKQSPVMTLLEEKGMKWVGKSLNFIVDSNKLRIFTLTWNMHGNFPPDDLSSLLPTSHSHHIIAVSSQECLRSISKSFLYSSKKAWEMRLSQLLDRNYTLFASGSLGSIHLVVFASKLIESQLSSPVVQKVRTGFGNVLSNKGAVGIKFHVGNTSLLLVSCHLTSGQDKVDRRNEDFKRIERKLMREWGSEPASGMVDACVYMGDLNYRINGRKEDVEYLVNVGLLAPLRIGDQLWYQMHKNPIFSGFSEGLLDFAPTFKFNSGTSEYDTSQKNRIPSWTDRIIYKSRNALHLITYNSINSSYNSDHRPVYAQFTLQYNTSISSFLSRQ